MSDFPNPSTFTTADGLKNRWYFADEHKQMMVEKERLDAQGMHTSITHDVRSNQYNLTWCPPKKG